MFRWKITHWPVAVAIGLIAGMVLSGVWPYTPLHAVSTDRTDTFAIATGPLDAEVEAVYILDFLTGDLTAVVLGKQPTHWTGHFRTNVSADLGVDPQKNPKFMMVTGVVGLRRGGGSRWQPSSAVCYVAEITSGKVAAYAVPWAPSQYAAGQLQESPLILVGVSPFRNAGATVGAGTGTGATHGTRSKKQQDFDR